MPESPRKKKDEEVANDQKERGYYYDDAHGYEVFEPEDEEPEEDTETPDQATRRNRDAETR